MLATPHETDVDNRDANGTNVARRGRVSNSEKMAVIAPGIAPEVAKDLIEEFCKIFVRKSHDSIVTAGGNARDWFANRWSISAYDVIRHLVGGQIPDLTPKWVGTKSWPESSYFVIDIDSDRHAPCQDASSTTLQSMKRRPSFVERCNWIEQCLSRLGIDAHDSRHTLRQPTPSGGIHLYVFLASMHRLEEIKSLLENAGICFKKGHAEFFPSISFGLRLPFGHLPGQINDPTAWQKFLRDYRSGSIERFSLQSLRDHLTASGYVHERSTNAQSKSRLKTRNAPSNTVVAGQNCTNVRGVPLPGQLVNSTNAHSTSPPEVNCPADIDRIWQEGIVERGTRNKILKDLAAHLIFIKGHSAVEAETILVSWALNPRHDSEDIQNDLRNGSNIVANEIARMCTWYEKHRKHDPQFLKKNRALIHREEVIYFSWEAVRKGIPQEDRVPYVSFLLCFLNFAKIHGTNLDCGLVWEAAPAVRQVMRKWPGSHHMNYKRWIEIAIRSRLLSVVRPKWQNPRGKGRAQTYQLKLIAQCWARDPLITLDYALEKLPQILSKTKEAFETRRMIELKMYWEE